MPEKWEGRSNIYNPPAIARIITRPILDSSSTEPKYQIMTTKKRQFKQLESQGDNEGNTSLEKRFFSQIVRLQLGFNFYPVKEDP